MKLDQQTAEAVLMLANGELRVYWEQVLEYLHREVENCRDELEKGGDIQHINREQGRCAAFRSVSKLTDRARTLRESR